MRLGIFAGGFKPFHAGHFAKLALAASENDKAALIYGMAGRQKNSDFNFTEGMAREIFEITRDAVQSRMSGRVAVIEGRPSPWTVVFEVMAAVFRGVEPKNPEVASFVRSLGPLEEVEITIYSSAADAERDAKFVAKEPEALQTGRLRVDIGEDESGTTRRIERALQQFQSESEHSFAPELVGIRGSGVRAALADGAAEEIARLLPPILDAQQKKRVLHVLRPDRFALESKRLARIMEKVLKRRAKMLRESAPEAHILNFYEDLGLPIQELKEAIRALLEGRVENVQEKLDGQNLTFTVRNGAVETFTKGTSWSRVQKGGRKLEEYDAIYSELPTVRDAFKLSHSALQAVADRHPDITQDLFRDGGVVVEASMMIPSNPNTIQYDVPRIVFIGFHALDPSIQSLEAEIGQAYAVWSGLAAAERSKPIELTTVPVLGLNRVLNSDDEAARLEAELDAIVSEAGLPAGGPLITVGDVIVGLVERKLIEMGLSRKDAIAGAKRIALGQRASNPIRSFEQPDVIKQIESSNAFLDDARIPLERVIQRTATIVFRNLEFALASNDPQRGKPLRDFVRRVRSSVENGNVLADPEQLRSIRTALDRIGNEEAFEKAVEGIVFTWKGQTRKLTGLFTPINKLRSFFNYGKSPARFSEAKIVGKVLAEIARRKPWAE